jgi:hypothetical protein
MCTGFRSTGLKRPTRQTDKPPSSAEVKDDTSPLPHHMYGVVLSFTLLIATAKRQANEGRRKQKYQCVHMLNAWSTTGYSRL